MADQNQGASIEAELLNIGAQMANVMFNLAQRPGEPLTGDTVAMMDSLRKQWDAARRSVPPAAPNPIERASEILGNFPDIFRDAPPAAGELPALPPTKEMLLAGMRHFHDKRDPATKAWECYRDMINAADRAQRKQAGQYPAGVCGIPTWCERLVEKFGKIPRGGHLDREAAMEAEIADLRTQLASERQAKEYEQRHAAESESALAQAHAQLARARKDAALQEMIDIGQAIEAARASAQPVDPESLALAGKALAASDARQSDPDATMKAAKAFFPEDEAGAQPDQRESAAALNGVTRYTVYTNCHHSDGHEIVPEPDGDYILYADAVAALAAAPSPAEQPVAKLKPCECRPEQRARCDYCAGYGKEGEQPTKNKGESNG